MSTSSSWFRELFSARRGVADVLVSMIPQVVGLVTGFLGAALIARGLGPAGLGQYALVMSLAGIAASLSDLGIGQTAIRFASQAATTQDRRGLFEILSWAFRFRMLLVAGVTAVLAAVAPLVAGRVWNDPGLTPYLQLGLAGGVFGALCSIPSLYFQSLRRFGVNAFIVSAQRILVLLGICVLAWLGSWSLFRVLGVHLAAHAAAALVFLAAAPAAALFTVPAHRRWFAPPDLAHRQDGQQPGSFAGPMMLSSVIVLITMQADVWMMGAFLDRGQLGLYSAAMRFTLPLAVLLGAINTALWPRASSAPDAAASKRLLAKTFRMSVPAAGVAALYAFTAPILTPWIFGDAYAGASTLGTLLCIRYALAILICPIGIIGYSFGMVRHYWWINLLQLLLVGGLNLALLPCIGATAPALALIVNDTAGFLLGGFMIWTLARRHTSPAQHRPEAS